MPRTFVRPIELADRLGRADVLASIAGVIDRAGDHAAALAALATAEACLERRDPETREHLLQARAFVARAVAIAGVARATAIVERALRRGDVDDAYAFARADLLAQVDRPADAFAVASDPRRPGKARVSMLIRLGETAAARGRRDVAGQAWDRALAEARALTGHLGRDAGWALRDVALATARCGDEARFRAALAGALEVAGGERSMTVQLAPLVARAGDLARARAAIRRDEPTAHRLLLAIARAALAASDAAPSGTAHRAVEEARSHARARSRLDLRALALVDIAEVCDELGDRAGADELLAEAAAAVPGALAEGMGSDAASRVARALGATGRDPAQRDAARALLAPLAAAVDAARDAEDCVRLAGTHERLGEPAAAEARLVTALEWAGALPDADRFAIAAGYDLDGWQTEAG